MTNTVSRLLSDETLNRIIQIESAGKVKAKAPTSSALGLFQFLNGTWLDTVRKHRPDLLEENSQAKVLALRTDPTICIELGARFTEDNAKALGRGCTDGDLYLAHFLGIGAAKKFLAADPDASAAKLAGAAAVKANRSILAGKTAEEVRAWAQASMVSRWAKAGRPDWIARLYEPATAVIPAELTETADEAKTPQEGQPEAVPTPPDGDPEVFLIQRRLQQMGYYPGMLDGKWGGKTAGEIAGFKNDRGLKGPVRIDAALKAELDKAEAEGFKRPIAEARSTATAETIPGNQTVKQTWRARIWNKLTFVFTGGTAGVGLLSETVETTKKPYDWAQEHLPWVLTKWWFYVGLIGMGCTTAVWMYTRRAEQATIDDYREGKLV